MYEGVNLGNPSLSVTWFGLFISKGCKVYAALRFGKLSCKDYDSNRLVATYSERKATYDPRDPNASM